MLVKFWLTVFVFSAATSFNTLTASQLLSILECASPLPCVKPSTSQATITLPTTSPTPPTSSKAPCKNCPQPDCTMVSNGTAFSYVNHCKLFYQCIDGVAEVCVCPNGYWYDRAISKCMLCELVLNCEANKD